MKQRFDWSNFRNMKINEGLLQSAKADFAIKKIWI